MSKELPKEILEALKKAGFNVKEIKIEKANDECDHSINKKTEQLGKVLCAFEMTKHLLSEFLSEESYTLLLSYFAQLNTAMGMFLVQTDSNKDTIVTEKCIKDTYENLWRFLKSGEKELRADYEKHQKCDH
jgi:hypothetical protein